VTVPAVSDGGHTFYIYAVDYAGNIGATGSHGFQIDATAPTGVILVGGGIEYATSTSVSLWLTYSDDTSGVSQVRYSNDGVWDTESWETPALSKAWTLTSGDGTKTVYYQIKDNAGNTFTNSDSIILDTTGPSTPVPDDGVSGWSSDSAPTFSWSAVSDAGSGVAGYYWKIGSGGVETWTTGTSVTLPAQPDGSNGFYVRAVDNAGNSGGFYGVHSFQIDTTPPSGSITINGGDYFTNSASVTLTLTYDDATSGVDQVRYSNDGVWDTESWETPSATKAWTLSGGNGLKTVYYQIRDNAGVESTTYTDDITLSTTAPYGSITINDDDIYTTSTSVTLSLTYEAPDSTVSQVRYSNDGVWDTEQWESPSATKAWTLTGGDGTKTVYYQVKNTAELESATYSDAIVLDTSTPTGSIIIDGNAANTTSMSVPLTISASDGESGVVEMRFSNDEVSWSSWEPYSTSKIWTLSSGVGTKTVYTQFRNGAGLDSGSYSDSIELVEEAAAFEEQWFNVTVDDADYVVGTCSNSSISGVSLNVGLKRLQLTVEGEEGTSGFCNVTVPAELMSGDFLLYLDDSFLVEDVDYVESFNGTHYLFSIQYVHSSHVLELFSTNVVPEFAAWLFLPFMMLTSLLGILLRKRLEKQRTI
jgi:hypothetical protein